MGVQGLWQLVKLSAVVHDSLGALALKDGYADKPAARGYRVGIDASIWLHTAQNTFAVGHTQSGLNPELRLLFYRLARLLALPINPVFVFDGPNRPRRKRGTNVVPVPHWLVSLFEEMLGAFGFHKHVAPGEAEAELAVMNALGIIDAVLTEDSDALAFGASTVVRRSFSSRNQNPNEITVYTSGQIESGNIGLTRDGMVLIAVLSGCDYDQHGLTGFGSTIAHCLAHYGIGTTLCAAARAPDAAEESRLVSQVRQQLVDCLRQDPEGHLGRRYETLAASVPSSFPNLAIARAFTQPLVSSTPALLAQEWLIKLPNIPLLTRLCERHFSFALAHLMLEKFKRCIWAGVGMRVLMSEAIRNESSGQVVPSSPDVSCHVTSTFGSLFQIDVQEAGNGPGFPMTKLMLKPITFNDVVSASLTSSMNIGDHIVTTPQYEAKGIQCELVKKSHLLHVPTAVLARARPQYANAFLLTGSSLYPPASRLSAVSAEARLMRQTAPTLATMRAHRWERYHRYAMSHKSESFIDLTCDADLRVIHLTGNTTPAASSSVNVIDLTGDSTPGASGSNIIDLTHDDVSEASMDITNEIIDLTGDVV